MWTGPWYITKEVQDMKKIAMYISGIMFLTASGMTVYGANGTKTDMNDAKTLFEKQCSVCHKFERATSKKKVPAGWEKTVKRMKESNGAKITDEEAKIITEYLANNYGK
jgi:hypothetical protein